jgi:hypothetical protein
MNEAQRRDQFLSLVRNRMDPALRGADYDRCFNSVRAERPDLLDNRAAPTLAIANSFDPSQPRDEQGQWTEYDSPGSAPEGDTGKPKKRAMFGTDLVEWDDEEQVARRYEVQDFKSAFQDWKPKRMKEEKSFKGNAAMAGKFDALHKSNGGHIRTGTKIKWPTPAAPTGPGNGMPVVGGATRYTTPGA